MYTHTHTHTHIYICINIYIQIYIHKYTYIYYIRILYTLQNYIFRTKLTTIQSCYEFRLGKAENA